MSRARRPAAPPVERRKFVVMNGMSHRIKGLPEPTRPIDDFSVALWAFAELALEKNGLEVAQINYWGGRPLHNLYDTPIRVAPEHTVAQIWFFHDADRYRQARALNAWAALTLELEVHADGTLVRRMINRRNHHRESKKVGNILAWKFSKAALSAPRVVEA